MQKRITDDLHALLRHVLGIGARCAQVDGVGHQEFALGGDVVHGDQAFTSEKMPARGQPA